VTATDLLATLAALGVTVYAVEDRLRIKAPAGTLTPELRSALADQKPALLGLLREPPRVRAYLCSGCGRFHFPEPAFLCYWCRNGREVTHGCA
jgi:hypothetical protein